MQRHRWAIAGAALAAAAGSVLVFSGDDGSARPDAASIDECALVSLPYGTANLYDCPDGGATSTSLSTEATDPTTTVVSPTSTSVPAPTSTVTPSTSSSTTSTTSSSTSTTSTAPAATTTTAPPTTTTAPPSGSFAADFTTDQRALFDFHLHTSSIDGTPTQIAAAFQGEHNHACGDPMTYRTIHGGQGSATFLDVAASELVWYCAPGNDPAKGHMMTALDTCCVATLSFSPKQTFMNPTSVCWDQNMNNLGEGKWVNIYVVPASHVVANGGNLGYEGAPALGGGGVPVPPNGFHLESIRGSNYVRIGTTLTLDWWNSTFASYSGSIPTGVGGMVPDSYSGAGGPSAPRFTVCLKNGGRTLEITRPGTSPLPNGTVPVESRSTGTVFPSGAVKVIFQDGSYNPTKHGGLDSRLTWHWDNIRIGS